MAHVVNISGRTYPLEIGTSAGRAPRRFELRPGDVADIDDAYAVKRYPAEGRDPIPSIVEQMTNKCVIPADDPRARELYNAWCEKMNSPAPQPESPPTRAPAQKGR